MTEIKDQSRNKTISKNTAFLYLRMLFVLFVSLYTSRVVLNTLGVVDYGVYNVVAGFVSLFSFLNATLASSMQRFYNYEGTLSPTDGYNNVYSSGLLIHLVLCAVLLIILETVGIWYLNNRIVIPAERMFSANVVYQSAIMSLLLLILQIPYMGAILASEKMSFYALVSIADVLIKLVLVIILPHLPYDKLIMFSLISLSVSLFNFLCYYIYAKGKLNLRFRRHLKEGLFKSIFSFSQWNLLGTFAFMIKGQGINLMLNSFFGPVINAARGISYQVNSAITGFSSNITIAFRPQIVNSYAAGEHERVESLFITESKICFVLISLLVIPVIIEMDYLLNLWLGDVVPNYTKIFTTLVLLDSLVNTLNTPCSQVAFAVGQIQRFQIASSIVNLLLLPFCWIGLHVCGNPVVVFSLTIIFSIINQGICLYQLLRIFKYSISHYIKKVIFRLLVFILTLPVIPYIVCEIMPSSFVRLVLVVMATLLYGILATYFLVLDFRERGYLMNLLRKKR